MQSVQHKSYTDGVVVSASHRSCCSHWVLARAQLMPNFATLPLIVERVSSIEITFHPSEANCVLVSMAWVAREQVFLPAKLFSFQSCLAAVPLSTSFAEDQGLVMHTDSLQPISHLCHPHSSILRATHAFARSSYQFVSWGSSSSCFTPLDPTGEAGQWKNSLSSPKKPPLSQGFWRIE